MPAAIITDAFPAAQRGMALGVNIVSALAGSFIGLVAAHTVLNVPLVMMVMGVAVRDFDLRIEQVAWSLGDPHQRHALPSSEQHAQRGH